MSTAANQDLSLAKLKRAVSSSVSDYTTISSLGQNGGGGSDILVWYDCNALPGWVTIST